jgi:hypothetical protein
VNQVCWRKRHPRLQPRERQVRLGRKGENAATLDGFVDEFASEASAAITAMSMDMSPSVTWLHRLCDLRYRPRRLVEDWSSSFTTAMDTS